MKYVPTLIKQFQANVGKSCKNGANMDPKRNHLWKLLNIKIFGIRKFSFFFGSFGNHGEVKLHVVS